MLCIHMSSQNKLYVILRLFTCTFIHVTLRQVVHVIHPHVNLEQMHDIFHMPSQDRYMSLSKCHLRIDTCHLRINTRHFSYASFGIDACHFSYAIFGQIMHVLFPCHFRIDFVSYRISLIIISFHINMHILFFLKLNAKYFKLFFQW